MPSEITTVESVFQCPEFPGKKVATDLHLEHLNKVCKEAVKGRANKQTKAISKIGNAMGLYMHSTLKNFDLSVLKTDIQGWHEVANAEGCLSAPTSVEKTRTYTVETIHALRSLR